MLQDIIVNAEGNIQHNKYNISFMYLKTTLFSGRAVRNR